MKEYINGSDKYYSVKCDKCGSYMKNEFTFRDMIIWICPQCNHDVMIENYR